jgi:hypothetical protein
MRLSGFLLVSRRKRQNVMRLSSVGVQVDPITLRSQKANRALQQPLFRLSVEVATLRLELVLVPRFHFDWFCNTPTPEY